MNLDDLFDVLADERRRRILAELVETSDATHVGLLRKRCDVDDSMLYHVHLPKMDHAGLVDYDAATGDVALTDDGTEVERFLRAIETMQSTAELPTVTAD